MEHFEAFHSEGELLPPFSDPEPDLHKCAEIIQQLDFICAQLPAEKFGKPTVRIKKKFAEVETELLKHFEHAWTVRDLDGMREYAHALFPFESYVLYSHYAMYYVCTRLVNRTPLVDTNSVLRSLSINLSHSTRLSLLSRNTVRSSQRKPLRKSLQP